MKGTFEIGKTYKEIMIMADREYEVKCIRRTAKFVTFETHSGTMRKKISTSPGFESVHTNGSVIYSIC